MNKSLGIDVAGCNGRTNWDVAKLNGVHFGAARASISWGYQDKWFPDNWAGMKKAGIHRFAYHILYPGESYKTQAENFLRVVGGDWSDAYPVLDVELDHDQTRATITDCTLNWLEYVKSRAPKPLIYSRAAWIAQFTMPGAWRGLFDWWLAQYLDDRKKEHPGPPPLPSGVTTWLVHQNADHFIAWPGLHTDSIDLDIDRWNGDEAAVDRYFGAAPAPLPEPYIDWRQEITRWARRQPDPYIGPDPEGT
jgi:GH25 family lysozyme M1 (1,4-beta-N-acetylmuramidase)